MNHTTRFFNGTRDGNPYQAQVTKYVSAESQNQNGHFIVNVVIFNSKTGEAHYSFERNFYDTESHSMREAVRQVIKNPDDF